MTPKMAMAHRIPSGYNTKDNNIQTNLKISPNLSQPQEQKFESEFPNLFNTDSPDFWINASQQNVVCLDLRCV
jgi:hypothetical protein